MHTYDKHIPTFVHAYIHICTQIFTCTHLPAEDLSLCGLGRSIADLAEYDQPFWPCYSCISDSQLLTVNTILFLT